MQKTVAILWFLTRVQLWVWGAIGLVHLLSVGFVMVDLPQYWGVDEQRDVIVGMVWPELGYTLLCLVVCFSYILYFRSRIDAHPRVKYAYVLLMVGWPGAWLFPIATAAVAAILIFAFWCAERLRIPPGHCRQCRYDLTGNQSGVCPECGAPLTSGEMETLLRGRPVAAELVAWQRRHPYMLLVTIGALGVAYAAYRWVPWERHLPNAALQALSHVFRERATDELWSRFDRGLMTPTQAHRFHDSQAESWITTLAPYGPGTLRVTLHVDGVYRESRGVVALECWEFLVDGDPVTAQPMFADSRVIFLLRRLPPGRHTVTVRANLGPNARFTTTPSVQFRGPYGWLIERTVEIVVPE
ncbi:MAG: hypothetical protein JXB13_07670 [Phycisphaerae bacterium]|nr:hypothetical protein [Phycisphaerae bacterium]